MKTIFLYTIVLMTSCIIYSCKSEIGESETILLPNNYKGAIYIIYDQKQGQPGKYEKGSRIFEVPENGIIRSQLPPNNGWHQTLRCFYVLNGQRIEIPFRLV